MSYGGRRGCNGELGLDTTVAHSARIWNYWLGGKDNFAVDRQAGDRVAAMLPSIVAQARADRAFLGRAIRYLAGEAGVRQFLDIGTGLPTADNTHEVAQRMAPETPTPSSRTSSAAAWPTSRHNTSRTNLTSSNSLLTSSNSLPLVARQVPASRPAPPAELDEAAGDNERMAGQGTVDRVRGRIGAAIFERVAGPQGLERRALINEAGERWFGADRPIRRVHGDSAMFIGGIRALLLQSLHPLAMAAVAGHSGYRGDPWGRLQRTSYFLAVTTFGRASDAEEAIGRVRAIHERVTGTAPDGRLYAASDPRLLTWVHIAEADSFLRAHGRFGARPLGQEGRDGYVADLARIGAALGVPDPPRTEAELAARIAEYRGELAATAQARAAARFLLLNPPLPVVARPPYGVLAAAAVSLLPGWARRPLRLPRLPVTEAAVVRPAGHAMVHAIRWAISAPPPSPAT
jgi:uncharacterized protein (DUF2236 family)